MYHKILEKLKNKNIAILGFGKEGKSTYHFIRRYSNQALTILDKNDVKKNNPFILEDENLTIITGEDYLQNLEQYDLIIKSPGIALLSIDTKKIEDKITSQLEFILDVDKENIIGITGTKGKSTTSSLLYQIIKNQNENTFLLGNIGNPILDYIEQFDEQSTLVIEMSSHQLEYIKKSPHIGVILNLYQDHLDHTGTLEKYHNDKMHMFQYQEKNDIGIYDGQNDYLINLIQKNHYQSTLYNFKVDEVADIYVKNNMIYYDNQMIYDGNQSRNLIGSHNLKNIMVALFITKLLNLDVKKAIQTINKFHPLEHRLERVGTYHQITYFNDTIATIPEATINGINGLGNVDTLIFGGMDREIDYTMFIKFLESSNVMNLIGLPTTGHKICKELMKKNINKNIFLVDTLDEAVDIADQYTKPNHICLLSPAASSYNQFKNFEEKGKYYKDVIKRKYENSSQ